MSRTRILIATAALVASVLSMLGGGAALADSQPTKGSAPTSSAAWPVATAHAPSLTAKPRFASTPGGHTVEPLATWGCPDNFSCFYDGHNGTNLIWIAPACGFYDLGAQDPPLNDRISSIANFGHGSIQPYNWVGFWQPVGGAVPVGKAVNYLGGWDNIIDAVSIAC